MTNSNGKCLNITALLYARSFGVHAQSAEGVCLESIDQSDLYQTLDISRQQIQQAFDAMAD